MNLTRFILILMLLCLASVAAQAARTMFKDDSNNSLIEDFKVGPHKVTFGGTSTAEFLSGVTVNGASYLRAAADLQQHSSVLDVYAGISPSTDMQSFLAAANDSAARTALGVAIGSDVQAWSGLLDQIAASTPSSGLMYWNAGVVSYTATSLGGNDSADAGKVPLYDSGGQLNATRFVHVTPSSGEKYANYGADSLTFGTATGSVSTALPTLTGDVLLVWPVASGSLVSTGDSETVSSPMLVPTGVTASTYGSATQSLHLTVNTAGQITALSQQTVTPAESSVTFTDITTGNASTSKHGYLPKLNGSSTQYLNGSGAWSTPPSGITIGTTAITGGTSGRLLNVNGSVVGQQTLDSNVSSWLASPSEANLKAATSGIQWLDTAGTITAVSAASTPARYITGAWYSGGSGTTTTPHVLIQPSTATAATNWNTDGTGLAINGHSGTLLDIKTDGVGAGPYTPASNFRVDADGAVYFGAYKMTGGGYGSCTAVGNLYYGSGAGINFQDAAVLAFNFDTSLYQAHYGLPAVTGVLWLTAAGSFQELRIAANGQSNDNLYLGLKFDGTDGILSSTGKLKMASPIAIPSGTNQRAGNVTLVAGTATVSNTTITSNTLVLLTRKTAGGTVGDLTYTLTAGSSFTINSDSATDTSVITYLLIENP